MIPLKQRIYALDHELSKQINMSLTQSKARSTIQSTRLTDIGTE